MTEEEALFSISIQSVKENYSLLKDILSSLGPVKYEYKKTSIHCIKSVAFLGIHPKKNWIDLNIVLDRPLSEITDCKIEQVSKNRFHNEIRVKEAATLNELTKYFVESYEKSRSN